MNEHIRAELEELRAVVREYQQRFPEEEGYDWVAHPQLLGDWESYRALGRLMRQALRTGRPLTQAEIDAKIGPVSWLE